MTHIKFEPNFSKSENSSISNLHKIHLDIQLRLRCANDKPMGEHRRG